MLQQNADLNSLLLLGDQIFLHVDNFDKEMDEGDVTARRLERLVQAAKNFDWVFQYFTQLSLLDVSANIRLMPLFKLKKIELFYLLLDDPIGNKQHALLGPAVHANIGAVFVKSRVRFNQILKIGLINVHEENGVKIPSDALGKERK